MKQHNCLLFSVTFWYPHYFFTADVCAWSCWFSIRGHIREAYVRCREVGEEESGITWGVEKNHLWMLHSHLPVGPSITALSILHLSAVHISPLDHEHLRPGIMLNSSLGSQCLVWFIRCKRFSVRVCLYKLKMNEWIMIKGRTTFFLASTTNLEEWLKAWERELRLCEEDNDWICEEMPPTNRKAFVILLLSPFSYTAPVLPLGWHLSP